MLKLSLPATLLTLAALAAVTFGPLAHPAPAEAANCNAAGKNIKKKNVKRAKRSMICLVNNFRAKRGKRPLKRDGRLSEAAGKHSRHMERVGVLGHSGIGDGDPSSRARRAGLRCSGCVAENVAYHTGNVSPKDLFKMWKGSAPHAQTMRSGGYKATGIGISVGPRLGVAITQMFAAAKPRK